jgi:hypothetical protein
VFKSEIRILEKIWKWKQYRKFVNQMCYIFMNSISLRRWGISWLAEWLLACQEGPCCMELFLQEWKMNMWNKWPLKRQTERPDGRYRKEIREWVDTDRGRLVEGHRRKELTRWHHRGNIGGWLLLLLLLLLLSDLGFTQLLRLYVIICSSKNPIETQTLNWFKH